MISISISISIAIAFAIAFAIAISIFCSVSCKYGWLPSKLFFFIFVIRYIGVGALLEDVQELRQGLASMSKQVMYAIESIWYAPDSLEEKGLVLKDIFADHKPKWISGMILATAFVF